MRAQSKILGVTFSTRVPLQSQKRRLSILTSSDRAASDRLLEPARGGRSESVGEIKIPLQEVGYRPAPFCLRSPQDGPGREAPWRQVFGTAV